MQTNLNIPIECGETTCASEPGKFCRFMGSKKFGQVPVCLLFRDENFTATTLEQENGWTKRCDQCLLHEKHEIVK